MKIQRRTLVLFKIWLIRVCVFAALLGIGYWYLGTESFTVLHYEVEGVPEEYKEKIIVGLKNTATQKFFGSIPANKILSYRVRKNIIYITTVLPNTESAVIRPIGLHSLQITVVPYIPLFKSDDGHGITADGIMYSELKDISTLPALLIASSTVEISTKDGIVQNRILGTNGIELKNLNELIKKVNSVLFTVSKVEIDANNDVYIQATGSQSVIKFSRSANYNKVWSNLVSAIDTEPLKGKLSSSRDSLEYLDVRFGNKVFYKFTNGDKTAIIERNATTTKNQETSH